MADRISLHVTETKAVLNPTAGGRIAARRVDRFDKHAVAEPGVPVVGAMTST